MADRKEVEIRAVPMWAIHYGNGWIDPHSVSRTRRQAIDAFTDDPSMPRWDYWRKQGCRAVKVRIVPDPTP